MTLFRTDVAGICAISIRAPMDIVSSDLSCLPGHNSAHFCNVCVP